MSLKPSVVNSAVRKPKRLLTRSVPDARRLFFGSIVYLPLIWILMIVDRI